MKLRALCSICLQISVLQVKKIIGNSNLPWFEPLQYLPALLQAVQQPEINNFILILVLEEQLDFPVLYASAKEGWASSTFTKDPPANSKNMSQLLDAIITHVPPPKASLDAPFQMLVGVKYSWFSRMCSHMCFFFFFLKKLYVNHYVVMDVCL